MCHVQCAPHSFAMNYENVRAGGWLQRPAMQRHLPGTCTGVSCRFPLWQRIAQTPVLLDFFWPRIEILGFTPGLNSPPCQTLVGNH